MPPSNADAYDFHDLRDPDRIGGGFAGAVALHLALAGALVAAAVFGHNSTQRWGENQASVGAIQASMVSALPLPPHAKPVEKQVLASEDENNAPLPPPKAATEPPPRPTDVLIKAKTPPPAKPAPTRSQAPPKPDLRATPTEAPPIKHAQPTPPTPKAETGETTATQLPQAMAQLKNGTATISTPDRAFGYRYAYYLRIVSSKVTQSWLTRIGEVDSRASVGRRVTVYFTIDRTGMPSDVRVSTASGSPTLDSSARHAVEGVDDGFGPLPAGNSIPIEFSFDYKAQ